MTETIYALVVVIVSLVIAIVLYFSLKQKLKVEQDTIKKAQPSELNLVINKKYLGIKELKFLELLNRVLPTECIAFPKVGVDTILSPTNNKLGYNSIVGNYVDVCIFLIKTMEPILVIDLYEDNTIKQGLKILNTDVVKALNSVKLPILKYVLKDDIDKDELKMEVLKSIKNEYLVEILTKKQ